MPFSVRVTGRSKLTGEIILNIEPPWWDSNAIMRDVKLINTSTTSSYRDYEADLSFEEIKKLHEKFLPETNNKQFSYSGWQKRIKPMIELLNKAINEQSNEYSNFHIWVFEWDSGY